MHIANRAWLFRGELTMKFNICCDISFLINALALEPYTHVLVRRKTPLGIVYLGGGFVPKVLSRFGTLRVEKTEVFDDKLIIYVR